VPGAPAAAASLIERARGRDDWRPWLTLLESVGEASRDPGWRAAVPGAPAHQIATAPLLTGATLTVPAHLARRWLQRLIRRAAPAPLAAAARADTDRLVALLEAGLVEDAARVAAIAGALDVDVGALGAVAGLAPVPLLRACSARWAGHVPPAWPHGHCPVCGAWPSLAELRGLERERHLRCGRCAADWTTAWLRCAFCGTQEHEHLRSLVPTSVAGGPVEPLTTGVDTCQACRGYLKTVTTLTATGADDLGLLDLTTVELDTAALARGYARPAGPGAALGARVVITSRWWSG
jgi:FdhE protein